MNNKRKPSQQVHKKWDQNDRADPEKQPALEESDLKPAEGEGDLSHGPGMHHEPLARHRAPEEEEGLTHP